MESILAAVLLWGLAQVDDPITSESITSESITVTAEPPGTAAEDSAAAVTVVSGDEIERSAAPGAALDDTLRTVPGFSLFRRSGSRTANPTTLGATLRGVGGTAASRALVLADGVPLGDPFGGWVRWSEVPAISLTRVEVLSGGASQLYGSGALTGVIQLVRREPAPGALRADLSAGSRDTAGASAWGAQAWNGWDLTASAAAFQTDGHVRLARGFRGPVDVAAGSEHLAGEVAARRGPLTLRLAGFDETRDNGTPLQGNDTRRARADARWQSRAVEVTAWGSDQTFRQTFSAVADDRATERLVRAQEVPSSSLGGRFVWRRSFDEERHLLRTGLEARRLSGVSQEQVFLPPAAGGRTIDLAAGGRQLLSGAFIEDRWQARPDLTVTVGLRFDRWDDRERGTGDTRHRDAWSPRLAVRLQATERWGVVASGYQSFRAPTLNELYRGFRVGSVVTDPNPALDAERLTGFELGLAGSGGVLQNRLQGRVTLFRMDLDDPIANVTLGEDGGLVLRQRRNLGAVRSQGLEATGRLRTADGLAVRLGALWTDAEVIDNPADRTLEGRRVPQVPDGELSLAVSRAVSSPWGRWTPSVAVRFVGDAFEDDRNTLELPGFTDLSATLAFAFAEGGRLVGGEVYVAGENLLDEEITVGRTPLPEVGAPRSFSVGLRWATD